jgi:hypothetical protein
MQYVIPPTLQVYTQLPDGQEAVAPVGLPHERHVGPHWAALLTVQAPFTPHGFCPLGHWHVEPLHCLPPEHGVPHPPQLALSFV